MNADRLPTTLRLQLGTTPGSAHACVAPALACPFAAYQDDLHATRPDWEAR
jgi:hypothetical protein